MSNVEIVYESSLDSDLRDLVDPRMRQAAAQLTRWVDQARALTNRSTMFDRGAYVTSENPFRQMEIARNAVENDDVVGRIAETLEGIALDGIKWECTDPDEMDIHNQMAAEQNLDAVVRKIFRETYTYSQVVLGFWWDWGEFTVRGKTTKGNARKKSMRVYYPRAVTTLDALKVVPVGMLHFGQEQLAWQATVEEIGQYTMVMQGQLMDEMMSRFYAGQYIPYDSIELQELTHLEIDPSRLILLNQDYVRRFTLTRPDHLRFPQIRMKRIFHLLDLKQQLMEADRVALIGAANYILLVKKGSKEDPAYPEEIQNLKENFNIVAKLPVIISDHRLDIEIISPKQDYTLSRDKYEVLDSRIASSMLGLFAPIGTSSGNRSDTTLDESRLVARNMENQRHMMRRFLEKEIGRAVINHPQNKGKFTCEPSLTFTPAKIKLDDDTGVAQQVIALRTMNELSRESTLEYFGFDQQIEAMRRTLEADQGLDDTFQTQVPFSAHNGTPPAAQGGAGGQGGRPDGGGQPSKNPQKAPTRTAKGTTKPAKG